MRNIAIVIDGSNFYASMKRLGFAVDYTKLKECFGSPEEISNAFYFTALPPKGVQNKMQKMADWLGYNGYTVVSKETTTHIDEATGDEKIKGNMDSEICVRSMELADHITDLVLCSGDGDFRCLVEAVQRKGVRVTVVSAMAMASDTLRKQATKFVPLEELVTKVRRTQDIPDITEPKKFGRTIKIHRGV